MILNPLPNGFAYWDSVKKEAKRIGSDGCSGPAMEFYQNACFEHDIHYRKHRWLTGEPITKWEADKVMRTRIQTWSTFGKLSPMSWWRWAAVTVGGWNAWWKSRPVSK